MKLYRAFLHMFLAALMVQNAYAVEVRPDIGFQQSQAPNGSKFNRNQAYQAPVQNQKGTLNEELFRDNQIGKAIPKVNSVGLNFTFKMD